MAGRGSTASLLSLLTCCLILHFTYGGYLITTPREYVPGYSSQFCVFVTNSTSPTGNLLVSLFEEYYNENSTSIFNKTINVPAGRKELCEDLDLPKSDYGRLYMNVTGNVSGKVLNITKTVGIRGGSNERIFIQTDKHLYQAGQTVQFRILTINGPLLNVSTDNYPEVWIETPSRTRIAQWLDVDNSAGIVHLSMTLVDEPEEGYYRIRLKTSSDRSASQSFKVGEYVLPRFELEIKRPSYVSAIHEAFNFTICARYTFGQPVKGNITLVFNNGQSQLCRTEIVKKENITGCQTYEFTTQEMKVTDCEVHSMRLSLTFEEEGTGVQKSSSTSISITRDPIRFNEVYADKYMKPNLPYTVKVKAEYPDGSPASNVPVEVCAAGSCNNMTTATDGIFTALLPMYQTNRIFMKTINCRADLNPASFSKYMEHFYSPSNSSILINVPENALPCVHGESSTHTLPLLFSSNNQTSAVITVQVMSRGRMQFWSSKEYTLTPGELPINKEHLVEPLPTSPEGVFRGTLNIPVTLPAAASPDAQIVVWYTRDDGEVVSDNREVEVEKCLPNTADLTWGTKKAEPGDETTVSLSSRPNSVCSLGVVDKSTLLLSQASDKISVDRLFSFANGYKIRPWKFSQIDDYSYCRDKRESQRDEASNDRPVHYYYESLYVDTIKMFDDAGLYVLTDLTVETRPCEEREETYFAFAGGIAQESPSAFGGGGDILEDVGPSFSIAARPPAAASPPPNAVESNKVSADDDTSSDSDTPRSDFPETWLWDIVVVPSTGTLNQTVTLPDTITEWVGSAVCALPSGVGLSKQTSITTFLPFFIDLTLPPSIKRGEILPVKISVFNYLDQTLPVTVRLEESAEYKILEDPNYQGPKGQRTICLASQDKDVVTVRIDALALGDVNLTVTAFVDYDGAQNCNTIDQSVSRRDTIIKPIKVDPEGYPREKTWAKYICTDDFTSGDDSFEVWQVNLPEVIVEGSDRGWVTAVGNLLALSLENLGHLIRMPYGCGEQNMLNFAPNIFLMKYLDATKQNTPETAGKLRRFMTTGYRRELLYRHHDGAFSAFGSADDFGSTWLTAFVLKSFHQAQDYILVDKAGLDETRNWLKGVQDEDGCFLSIGKIFHKGMKGGVTNGNNSIPLTTYVTISMLEAGEDPSSKTIQSAMKCINKRSTFDPYTLALKAYANTLAKLPEANQTIADLMNLATVNKNSIYWELPHNPSRSNAVQLETAAYAVLAMVEQNFDAYRSQVRKIIKWMITKRNGRGGFYSTQDTVMALQALASYESNLYQGPVNVSVTVTATNLTHNFNVKESNKMLQQQVSLPTFPTNVTLGMEGQGCAVMQAVLRYNIPDPEGSDAFDLTVNTRTEVDKNCKTKLITACASYKLPDEASNMAVIEVNLISGYIPEKDDLKKLVRENRDVIKRYEIDGSKVSFYIEELTAKSTCVNFKIIREVDVERVKPGTVVVYDYYQPEFSISENYTLPPPDDCRH